MKSDDLQITSMISFKFSTKGGLAIAIEHKIGGNWFDSF